MTHLKCIEVNHHQQQYNFSSCIINAFKVRAFKLQKHFKKKKNNMQTHRYTLVNIEPTVHNQNLSNP